MWVHAQCRSQLACAALCSSVQLNAGHLASPLCCLLVRWLVTGCRITSPACLQVAALEQQAMQRQGGGEEQQQQQQQRRPHAPVFRNRAFKQQQVPAGAWPSAGGAAAAG